MRLAGLLFLALAVTRNAAAQNIPSRGDAYLFSSSVEDSRAVWINPAGLGVLSEAAIHGEVAMDRGAAGDGNFMLRQYNLGLLSRNFGLGYQRDRGLTGGSQGTWRVGAGVPLGRRFALGTAVSFTSPERVVDVGLRASPVGMTDIGVVVRNIGRPNTRSGKLPIVLVGGISSRLEGGRFAIQADAIGTEVSGSGYSWQYRGGLGLTVPGKTPVTIFSAFRFTSGTRIDRLSVGVGVGSMTQLLLVGTSLPQGGGTTRIESFNVTGVARGHGQARR